jgi:hypothetical protein
MKLILPSLETIDAIVRTRKHVKQYPFDTMADRILEQECQDKKPIHAQAGSSNINSFVRPRTRLEILRQYLNGKE